MTDIRLANLTKLYGAGSERVRALDDVNLRIQAGEFFFLLGPSGCGKTTLLRIIAGLVEPSAGQLFFGPRRSRGCRLSAGARPWSFRATPCGRT